MDFVIARFVNRLGLGAIDGFTELVCQVPLLVALWTVLVLLALRFDREGGRRVALAVILAVGVHFLISEALLKHLVLAELPMRVRPYLAHPGEIVPIGHPFVDSSFPSSHAASTAAVLTVFAHGYRRALVAAVSFVALMAFSRVHNGMHYPTDVLAGSLLGVAYGVVAVRAQAVIARRRAARQGVVA